MLNVSVIVENCQGIIDCYYSEQITWMDIPTFMSLFGRKKPQKRIINIKKYITDFSIIKPIYAP
ncbi:hypothetical protein MOB1_25940 [Faecalimonas mobilis]